MPICHFTVSIGTCERKRGDCCRCIDGKHVRICVHFNTIINLHTLSIVVMGRVVGECDFGMFVHRKTCWAGFSTQLIENFFFRWFDGYLKRILRKFSPEIFMNFIRFSLVSRHVFPLFINWFKWRWSRFKYSFYFSHCNVPFLCPKRNISHDKLISIY